MKNDFDLVLILLFEKRDTISTFLGQKRTENAPKTREKHRKNDKLVREGGRTVGSGRVATIIE